MPKANPSAWFPNYIAKISYRKVDERARNWRQHRPYFDTWNEAHAFMVDRAEKRLKVAKAELRSAINFHASVLAMKEPTNG